MTAEGTEGLQDDAQLSFFGMQCQVLLIIFFLVGTLEGVMYWMVYGTDNWRDLKTKVLRLTKEVERKTNKDGTQGKKVKDRSNDLKKLSMRLFQMKYRFNIFTTGIFALSLWVLASNYQGQAIAVMPFTPPRIFRFVTARGLTDRPPNEGSIHFFFAMSCLALKENLHNMMGYGIPRGIKNPVMEMSLEMGKRYEERLGLKK
jgi:hypothetical protein